MKFLVDDMPFSRYECPFFIEDDRTGDEYCKCGNSMNKCEYFQMGHDSFYCLWLKEIEK